MARIFGPVPSRRLGRSLGVDLVPAKTCTYDCVYCQLGATTCHSLERGEWVPIDAVLDELAARLPEQDGLDHVTLSGSGEPTLSERLDEVIATIKRLTPTPVAVLTNGSLLHRPAVRTQLAAADLVVPTLAGGDEATWRAVNRPAPGLDFAADVQGLVDFAAGFAGRLWLEVFLVAGLNDADAQVARMAAIAARIAPDRVQLNTVTRPGTESSAAAVPPARLAELAARFPSPAEVIADYRDVHARREFVATRARVAELLDRRPCTIADLAAGLGIHVNEAVKYVEELSAAGAVEKVACGEKVYHRGTGSVPEG